MNKYLITYDLKNINKNYDSLYLAIKGLGAWWHYLDSTWIIKTNMNSVQIWNILAPHITTMDRMLIIKIDSYDKYGWLPQDAWDWLNSY